MTFAENLNRICKERGTTVTAVLKQIKLSTSKVTLWNNGTIPKPEQMTLLARALDCSVMDFFADEEDLARAEKTSGLVLNEDEWDIIRVFRELSNKEKHIVMAQVYKTEERLHSKE